MKISERLQLLKAGYSKKEIEALAEAEAKEVVEDVTSTEESVIEENKEGTGIDKYMEVITSLTNEVKELKNNIYQNNINNTEVKGTETLENEADKILASIINPLNNNKEEK